MLDNDNRLPAIKRTEMECEVISIVLRDNRLINKLVGYSLSQVFKNEVALVLFKFAAALAHQRGGITALEMSKVVTQLLVSGEIRSPEDDAKRIDILLAELERAA